jgi:hypothetical protein
LVTLLAAGLRRAQVDERGFGQVLEGNRKQRARVAEASLSTADFPFALKSARTQPVICDSESPATMVGLGNQDRFRDTVDFDHAGMPDRVWHARQCFREVKGGVFAMGDPEEEYLPVEIMDAAYRAVWTVRGRERLRGANARGERTCCGE